MDTAGPVLGTRERGETEAREASVGSRMQGRSIHRIGRWGVHGVLHDSASGPQDRA